MAMNETEEYRTPTEVANRNRSVLMGGYTRSSGIHRNETDTECLLEKLFLTESGQALYDFSFNSSNNTYQN